MNTEEFKFPDEPEKAEKFEVEIEDDTPEEDRGRKTNPPPEDPSDEELSSYSKKVQDKINKFTRGYHDERRAKESAERERLAAEEFARQVYEENKRLKGQLESGSKIMIDQHKSSVNTELGQAKVKLKAAFESGDSDALVAAQEEMSKATVRLDRAENLRPIQEPDNFAPPQRQEVQKLAPKTQSWVENNSEWFGKDEEMTMTAMGLDKKLQRQYGADYIGSDDYFSEVDKTMRKRYPEYFGSHEDTETSKNSDRFYEVETSSRAQKPASPVAPATRSAPPTRIRLKASQVALARKLGITPEQYAKQVALLGRNE